MKQVRKLPPDFSFQKQEFLAGKCPSIDGIIIETYKNKMSSIQTFKYLFSAQLGPLDIKANISSPTFVTWKRSQESVTSQAVEMINGKADFNKQIIQLPVNMYWDLNGEHFQEKKSAFSFTMKTPKGQKTAGVVYADLSKMLNQKLSETKQEYTLQKCPVSGSTVQIRIFCECLGQRSSDTQSQASMMAGNPSTLSIQSIDKTSQKTKTSGPSGFATEEVENLKKKVNELTEENKKLSSQLQEAKLALRADTTKQNLLKTKSLQGILENEVNALKEEKVAHERQLQSLREKLEEVYKKLYSSLDQWA